MSGPNTAVLAENMNQSAGSLFHIVGDIALLVFSLGGIAGLIVAYILFMCSMHKTMKYVPKQQRIFPNGFIWVFWVPFVGLVFQWLMLPFGIPCGLRNTLSDNNSALHSASVIKGLGLAMVILATLEYLFSFVHSMMNAGASARSPLSLTVSVVGAVIAIVLFILYWVKVVKFRKTYLEKKK